MTCGEGAGAPSHDPAAAVSAAFPDPPAALGVAVSGGSDSTALLLHLSDWGRARGVMLHAATVDHGLRPEALEEAAGVAALCRKLEVPHRVLSWRWDGRGNLPDAARRGRYAALAGWASGLGLGDVALGHTADDQAETVLMRLARGSGVDGLAAMRPRRADRGILWHRPFLCLRRADLRADLTARGIGWAEDPTNEDPGYQRVRARQALALLAPLGLTVPGLVETAERMQRASDALGRAALDAAVAVARVDAGDVVFDAAGLAGLPQDIRDRLISAAVIWVSSAEYRPRYTALRAAQATLEGGRAATLHGCLLLPGGTWRVAREPRAVRGTAVPATAAWDGRWRAKGPDLQTLTIAALGEEGLAACPDWRETNRPRAALLAAPAIWRGAVLVACPAAGKTGACTFDPEPGLDDYFVTLTSH